MLLTRGVREQSVWKGMPFSHSLTWNSLIFFFSFFYMRVRRNCLFCSLSFPVTDLQISAVTCASFLITFFCIC